jgi:hypothetical protein
MSNTYILYNNKKIPEPSPFVLLERENLYYNQYWGNSDKITLQGQITGYGCSPFNEIISGQEKVLNIFDRNFSNLQIFEPALIQPETFTVQSGIYKVTQFLGSSINQDQVLGLSVDMDLSGNLLLIGSQSSDQETGFLHVYYKEDNTFTFSEITGNTSASRFGSSVSTNSQGTILAIGAPIESTDYNQAGKVYIFSGEKTNWGLASILTGDINSKFFGESVSFNSTGNVLAIGAKLDQQVSESGGAVFIFTGHSTSWTLKNKIISDTISGNFGNAISVNNDGNIMVVGEYKRNLETGAVWIITGNGINWDRAAILTGDNIDQSNFGNAVSINSQGNIVLIGNNFHNQNTGMAYIFTGTGNIWNKAAKLSGSFSQKGFGSSVALNDSGNIAFIGARPDEIIQYLDGAVYVFTGKDNNWVNSQLITHVHDFSLFGNLFGFSIACNNIGNKILIGDEGYNFYQGAAYFYEQDEFYEKIYENSGIIVRSINFDNSNYAGVVDYSIELNSIRVSGNVLDPVNEFQFSENENKTVTLSHSISAKGINTNLSSAKSNALNNAISFVRSNTGLVNVPSTRFISGDINKFYLQNFSESIDRLNGAYSVQETYLNNYLDNNLSGNLTYTLDINSGSESNFIQINLRGQYKGPKNGNISNLRNSLNVTGLITGAYSGYFNSTPIQYNITENTGENSINFDYSFDNINLPNPYYRYESNISKDEIQQIYNVQVRGEIVARGNRNYRYFLSTGNIINLTGQFISVASGILTGFKDFNGDTYQSNLRLLNITIDENPNEGTVSANASYDDKYMPTGGATDASYSISVSAPRWYMNNQPTCNIKGFHIINDFDITTLPKISVNTSLKYKNLTGLNNENTLRSEIKNITNNIVPNNYNFNTKLQDSESYSKKINNFNSITEISYKLDKVDLSNQNGLLPKFNTI